MSATAKDGFIPVTNSQATRTLLEHATYSTIHGTERESVCPESHPAEDRTQDRLGRRRSTAVLFIDFPQGLDWSDRLTMRASVGVGA